MRTELQQLQKIEQFLLGSLTQEEMTKLADQYNNDSSFRMAVDEQKLIMESAKRKILRTQIDKAESTFVQKQVWKKWLSIAGIGSVILAIALIFGLWNHPSNHSPREGITAGMAQKDSVKGKKTFNKENLEQKSAAAEDTSHTVSFAHDHLKSEIQDGINETLQAFKPTYTKTQHFNIDPQSVSHIEGDGGVKIHFPADIMVYSDGSPCSTQVDVELQEYLALPDMVLAGLTTQTKDSLLKTAGMIHLSGKDLEGRAVFVAEGSSYIIEFPCDGDKQEGMHTFYGEKQQNGTVTWREGEEAVNLQEEESVVKNYEPYGVGRCLDCDMDEFLLDKVVYQDLPIDGEISLEITLDENGKYSHCSANLDNPATMPDPILLYGNVEQLSDHPNKNMILAKLERLNYDLVGEIISQFENAGVFIYPHFQQRTWKQTWKVSSEEGQVYIRTGKSNQFQKDFSDDSIENSLKDEFEDEFKAFKNTTGYQKGQKELDERLMNRNKVGNLISGYSNFSGYGLFAASFGLINCDAFINAVALKTHQIETNKPNAQVFYITSNGQSIISASKLKRSHRIEIPKLSSGMFIALSQMNDKYYYGSTEAKLLNKKTSIELEEMDRKKVKALLSKIRIES